MQMAEADLTVVKALDPHDRAVLGMASQQLALAAVKAYDSHGLDAAGLQRCRGRVASLHAAIEGKPQLDTEEAGPLLSLNNMAAGRHEAVLHPYWDRVVWQDVRGKEGTAQPIPKQMPVNFLCVPPRVAAPRQAAERYARPSASACCSRIYRAQGLRFPALLKVASSTSSPTSSPPRCRRTREGQRNHAWEFGSAGIKYGEQLELLLLLQRLAEHLAAAVFSTRASKSFGRRRVGRLRCDGGARRPRAPPARHRLDLDHLGGAPRRGDRTGILLGRRRPEAEARRLPQAGAVWAAGGRLHKQSESLEVSSPELHLARAAILDYFEGIDLGDSSRALRVGGRGVDDGAEPRGHGLLGQGGQVLL